MTEPSYVPSGPETAAKHTPGPVGPRFPMHPWPVSVEVMRHNFEAWFDTDRSQLICARCVRDGFPARGGA